MHDASRFSSFKPLEQECKGTFSGVVRLMSINSPADELVSLSVKISLPSPSPNPWTSFVHGPYLMAFSCTWAEAIAISWSDK